MLFPFDMLFLLYDVIGYRFLPQCCVLQIKQRQIVVCIHAYLRMLSKITHFVQDQRDQKSSPQQKQYLK